MKISILCALLIVCSVNIIKISSIIFLFSAAYAANISDHHDDHVEFEENSINPFDKKKRILIFYY